jgi:hypothetical protein
MTTRELLAEFATLMNEYGPTSEQANEFAEQHRFDQEFYELATLARRLKVALNAPVTELAHN